ncbi:MAG: hypothetical protein PHS60_12020, partial [Zavarzinia sp.]|nr:hypothetical protein [Zavarzinia sp.]
LQDPATYEALSPARFGRRREIVLGKHSGISAVFAALKGLGLATDECRARAILAEVRERAAMTKRSVGDNDLLEIYAHCCRPGTLVGAE